MKIDVIITTNKSTTIYARFIVLILNNLLTVAYVTIGQWSEVRNAMADDLINRRAARSWELIVVKRRRVTVSFYARFMYNPIDLVCCYSDVHSFGSFV